MLGEDDCDCSCNYLCYTFSNIGIVSDERSKFTQITVSY